MHYPKNISGSRCNLIVRSVLGDDADMPRRYQAGKLLIRKDVKRHYYYVRVSVPVIDKATGKRTKGRRDEKLGFLDEITLMQAEALRCETLQLVNSHRMIATSMIKFADVAKRFVDIRVPQLGFATQKKYRLQIKNHLVPFFGEMRLSEIDRMTIESFLAKKTDTLSWWSRIDLKGILSAIFTCAADWKLFEGTNPTERVRIGKKRLAREKRLLTAEQLRLILGKLDDECAFLVRLLFGLGLNISEALGLKWGDVNMEAGTITISRRWYRGHLSGEGELKTENRAASIEMGSLLSEEMRRRQGARGAFLFVGDGLLPPDDRDLLRERFRPVVKRLGLHYKGFGWHSFRRAHITMRQTVGGATPLEAQRAARHGSLDMTYLYSLNDPERERAQVDKMFDKLMEVPMGGKPV